MNDEGPKRGKDNTRTQRQAQYLSRLMDGKGKRVVVDLDSSGRADLELLLALDYSPTQSNVVRKALREAADRQRKKKE